MIVPPLDVPNDGSSDMKVGEDRYKKNALLLEETVLESNPLLLTDTNIFIVEGVAAEDLAVLLLLFFGTMHRTCLSLTYVVAVLLCVLNQQDISRLSIK